MLHKIKKLLNRYIFFNPTIIKNVSVGTNCYFNLGVIIDAGKNGKITIGDNCLFGPYVVVRAADHCFDRVDIPIYKQGHNFGHIVIEDNCWIGAHVTVTKNVRIGKGSVIGANSVVTHDIPEYSVAVGCPARVIKSRLDS